MRTNRRGWIPLAITWIALPTTGGASQVLVVEPGGVYSSFAAAYAAAVDGDTILVKATPDSAPTNYGQILIGSKNLTILGEPNSSGSLPLCSYFRVADVEADDSVTVRGFRLAPDGGSAQAPFQLLNNQGSVVLEDIHLPTNGAESSTLITSNANVTLIRCSAVGNPAQLTPFGALLNAGPALHIGGSTVYAYDCSFIGGEGAASTNFVQPGAAAISLSSSSFYANGGIIRGGKGGPGIQNGASCVQAASGGAGVHCSSATSNVRRLGDSVSGGAGGSAAPCPGSQTGPTGPTLVLNGATSTVYLGVARSLESNSPVRVGDTLHLEVKSTNGEFTFLAASPDLEPTFVPALKGLLLPALPMQIIALPPILTGGQLNVDLSIPPILPPGVPALDIAMQVLASGTLGTGVVGAPTVVTVLDPSL